MRYVYSQMIYKHNILTSMDCPFTFRCKFNKI